jgi:hypothetical protein
MADARPGNSAQAAESGRRLARVALAALLVAAVVAGLRGEIPPLRFHGPLRDHAVAIGLALEAVLAALMTALVIRRRRAPQQAGPAIRLRGILGATLTVGLTGIPLGLLLANLPKPGTRVRPSNQFQRPGSTRGPSRSPGPIPSHLSHLPVGAILTALLVIALVAAVIACVLMLRRQAGHATRAVLLADDEDDDDEQSLREAVESGRAALRGLDDARTAIIACYLAMERSLAGAGAARGAAETPDELLARAAAAGLVRGDAAGTLTTLFYEARFSSHPLSAASRTAAQRALGDLAASLAGPAAAAAPASAGETGETGP